MDQMPLEVMGLTFAVALLEMHMAKTSRKVPVNRIRHRFMNHMTDVGGMYGGVAPEARIAFTDCSSGGSGLSPPSAQKLYSPAYGAGARIHTNSWGTLHSYAHYYTGTDTDQFLFNNMVSNLDDIEISS